MAAGFPAAGFSVPLQLLGCQERRAVAVLSESASLIPGLQFWVSILQFSIWGCSSTGHGGKCTPSGSGVSWKPSLERAPLEMLHSLHELSAYLYKLNRFCFYYWLIEAVPSGDMVGDPLPLGFQTLKAFFTKSKWDHQHADCS